MGSTRFPGKVLAPFGASTVLGHILVRLQRVDHPVSLWVATSDRPEDDAVAAAADKLGIPSYRGEAEDVLARFVGCIDSIPARPELVLRICAIVTGKAIQRDPVRRHADQRLKIGKAACLRTRNAVKAHVRRNVTKTSRRIEAARQVQRNP